MPLNRVSWEAVRQTIDFIRRRKRDYQLTFNRRSPPAVAVLRDLAKFCRATETTFMADPRQHALLEGRREVYLRITQHLNLSSEDLYAILGGVAVLPEADGDTDG